MEHGTFRSGAAAGKRALMGPSIQSAALRGILWMVLCTGFQSCASGLVRKLSFEFGIF